MGRHSADRTGRTPSWARTARSTGRAARRHPLRVGAGLAVLALGSSTAAAATLDGPHEPTAAPASATSASALPSDAPRSTITAIDHATSEIARARYVADMHLIPDDTAADRIDDARDDLEHLVAGARTGTDVRAPRAVSRSQDDGRSASPRSATSTTGAAEADAPEADAEKPGTTVTDAVEVADPVGGGAGGGSRLAASKAAENPLAPTAAPGAGAPLAGPVLDATALQPSAGAPADAPTPAAEAISDSTAHLHAILDETSAEAAVSVVPAPTPEEVAAQEAKHEAARQAELASLAASTADYGNGQIPASALCAPAFAPGALLRCDAAERLEDLNTAYRAQFGTDIAIGHSYRSYSTQVSVKASRGYFAARPGTSNHGWGTAVDISDAVGGYGDARYAWMREHAPAFGWDNPDWARSGGSKNEPWHWEYTPGT